MERYCSECDKVILYDYDYMTYCSSCDSLLMGFTETLDYLRSNTRIRDLRRRPDEEREFLLLDPDSASLMIDGIVSFQFLDNEERLAAHKFILASRSPVFKKMFEVDMKENATSVVTVKDTTFPVMRAVIHFLYRADIDFSSKVPAEEVFKVAHKYGIGFLEDFCADELIETMDETNFVKRLKLSREFENEELTAKAKSYFKTHFDILFPIVWKEYFLILIEIGDGLDLQEVISVMFNTLSRAYPRYG